MNDSQPPWEKPASQRGLQRLVPWRRKEEEIAEITALPQPLKTATLPSGLEIAYAGRKAEVIPLTTAEKKERREDNKKMRQLHSKVRRRKRHGRR